MARVETPLTVELEETGPSTGIFLGRAQTGELPAGALSSDVSIESSPLMAIDKDTGSSWISEPDGATPKWLKVDRRVRRYGSHSSFTEPTPTVFEMDLPECQGTGQRFGSQ